MRRNVRIRRTAPGVLGQLIRGFRRGVGAFMIHPMSSDEPQPILQTARANLARVIDQLERDRSALAGKPRYADGEQALAAATETARRLAQTLESPKPS